MHGMDGKILEVSLPRLLPSHHGLRADWIVLHGVRIIIYFINGIRMVGVIGRIWDPVYMTIPELFHGDQTELMYSSQAITTI